MFYKNWMSYLSDEVKLKDIVMPGAHNAGSYGMGKMARCQDDDMFKQYEHGVRQFCIRLSTDKKGQIVLSHGPSKGALFEDAVKDMARMVEEAETEFFIFDIRKYYDKKIGPIHLRYHADPNEIDRLFEKYLAPEKYALTDFDIRTVTLGDIRQQGKRYVINSKLTETKKSGDENPSYVYESEYKYGRDCLCTMMWSKKLYGLKPENFAREIPKLFDINNAEGMLWFQVQHTPNLGTEVGLISPKKFNDRLKPYFEIITDEISKNPAHLKKASIICGDFMTDGFWKANPIIKLNLKKGNIVEGKKEEFLKALSESK